MVAASFTEEIVGRLDVETATDTDIAEAMNSQIHWLRNFDEVKPIGATR